MKDSTNAARLERATAELQVAITTINQLLGRLETLALQIAPETPPTSDVPPQSDPEAASLADKLIRSQLEEQKERASA